MSPRKLATLLLAGLPALHAQDQPLSVRGTIATGYYNTVTRGASNQSLSFVPLGARFEITGYYKSADFLNFTAQPELNVGPQASEAGFQGGNGIRFRVTALRRLIPLTFHYNNVQVEDVYFGGLSQVSGYSLKNRNKDLGVTLELKPARLPSLTVDWGAASVNSQSGIEGVADYTSHSRHINLDSQYQRAGWVMEGFLRHQKQQSDLLAPLDGSALFGSLTQTVEQVQGSARRSFWDDAEFYTDAGYQSTASLLFTLPVDLSTRYAGANLRLFQKRRFRTSLRAAYSSNLASQLLAQAVASLGGNGSTVPNQYALLPFSRSISNFYLNALTNITLPYGLGAYAAVERSGVLAASQANSLSAGYTAASAGLTYTKKLAWGNLSGEYGRELGLGSVTGQSGTIQGQTYRASVQKGHPGGLLLDMGVHGASQSIHNAQPLSNRSVAVEGNVSDRIAGNFSGRLGGGWQWGSIVNSANEFRTGGYTARAGIEHPRFQLTASWNDNNSNSLPFYDRLIGAFGATEILAGDLRVVPSDYRATSLGIHANPLRKVEFSATWSRSSQHLDGALTNDFEIINANVTYHYRRIQLEAGFIRFHQTFLLYPSTLRSRVYLRISRNLRIL